MGDVPAPLQKASTASRKVVKLFGFCGWWTALMGVFMIFMVTPTFRSVESIWLGEVILRVIGGILGVIGAPAALIIIIGMAIHCISNRNFTIGTKILWSIFGLLTAPFGAAFYFFTVYKRQTKIYREAANA